MYMDYPALAPSGSRRRLKGGKRIAVVVSAFMLSLYYLILYPMRSPRDVRSTSRIQDTAEHMFSGDHLEVSFRECLELHFDASTFQNVPNIAAAEFLERRDRLARALYTTSTDAFVVEPGYTFYYYANLSQPDWEPWEPEERPFLMVVYPVYDTTHETVKAKTFFLAPSFEVQRVLFSAIPYIADSEIIPWEEEEDPFAILADYMSASLRKASNETTIVADEELRHFIAKGIKETGITVNGLNIPISNVKETKSASEIAILRAANTVTVAGVTAVQACLVPGLTEKIVETELDNLYESHGLTPFFNLVLFEENAALPHGGVQGERKLARDDFVLIDVGVHLYYYSSDISRTFLMDSALSCNTTASGCQGRNETLFAEKLRVWDIVLEAQKAAIEMMRPGNTAASVDLAARGVIDNAGYEGAFTHRLGHGIGVKAHESPYLNRGNFARTLDSGMCFTAEPGVYISGVFGVRHEDVILVTDAEPELLTAGLARSPWHL